MAAYMDSSSSEDDAENERLQSAVWEHNVTEVKTARGSTTVLANERKTKEALGVKPSVRQQINAEYLDQFNEDHKNVTATPEFRTFIAKKLSQLLDSSIKTVTTNQPSPGTRHCLTEENDDDFKLLSTSCCTPSSSHEPENKPRKRPKIRRRKLSSDKEFDSSDSDVENQRLSEAAVSGHTIISTSAIAVRASSPSTAESGTGEECQIGSDKSLKAQSDSKEDKMECGNSVKRKKKLKRENKLETGEEVINSDKCSNCQANKSDDVSSVKKKKKKCKLKSDTEALNSGKFSNGHSNLQVERTENIVGKKTKREERDIKDEAKELNLDNPRGNSNVQQDKARNIAVRKEKKEKTIKSAADEMNFDISNGHSNSQDERTEENTFSAKEKKKKRKHIFADGEVENSDHCSMSDSNLNQDEGEEMYSSKKKKKKEKTKIMKWKIHKISREANPNHL